MGISEYKLIDAIPENIKTKLPTIDELENKIDRKNKNQALTLCNFQPDRGGNLTFFITLNCFVVC